MKMVSKELTFPCLIWQAAQKNQLIDEQNRDETLEKGEKGYTFDNGQLVHELTTPLEQVCTRIVVPIGAGEQSC